tara:strand:- start:2240 stop:2629 length:390 start_codon:yes stop_codon:yes gene_type:complete
MQDEGEEPDKEGEDIDTNDEGMTQQEEQDMVEERMFDNLIPPLPAGRILPVDPNMVQDPLASPLVVATTIPRQNDGQNNYLPNWGKASRVTGRGYRKKRSRKRTKRASKRRSKRVRRKTRRRKKSKRRR